MITPGEKLRQRPAAWRPTREGNRVKASCGATVRRIWERGGDALLFAGLFVASLALYLHTMAPSVATLFDDSLEFPLAAHQLAIAHPTGYPLYMLLGKAFTLGPVPNPAWAVNLLSALCGALAVAWVYRLGREWTRRRWPSLLGAAALAVSPIYWSQAIVAEVYALNALFVVATLWLTVWWTRQPLAPVEPFSSLLVEPPGQKPLFLPGESWWLRLPVPVRSWAHRIHRVYRRFYPPVLPRERLRLHPRIYGLAALYGLSLTHHRTMLLLAPVLLVLAAVVERRVFSRAALLGPEHPDRPRWRQVLGRPIVLLAICFLAPLLLYAYLPLRANVGSLDGLYTPTWRSFWGWVTGSIYSSFLGDNPLARNLDAAFYARLFWQQFGPVGLALALLGLLRLLGKPRALLLTAGAWAVYVLFAVLYRVPDVEVFFIPAFLIVALWIGVGLDYAVDLLRPRGPSMALRRLSALCAVGLVLAALVQPLIIGLRAYPDLDLSQRWIVHDYGHYVLQEPLPEDSTVVGLLGEMTLLRYFQRTAGLRPDLETIVADDEQERREAVEGALARGRTVYITRPLPGLEKDHTLDSVIGLIDVVGHLETLIRVDAPDPVPTDIPRPTDRELIPGLRLLGYGAWEHGGHWQGWVRLRLWWRAETRFDEPLKLSVRLLNAQGQTVAAADAEPVAGAYPTTAWRQGEIVLDAHEIALPAGLPPGDYAPLVIVYDPATGTERGRAELAPIALQGNPHRPPQRALEATVGRTLYARLGDLEVLGASAPSEISAGPDGTLSATVWWQALAQPQGDLRAVLWLAGDHEVALGEVPVGGLFPTTDWKPEQVVRQGVDLPLPGDIAPGAYQLRMRVERDGRPVPWSRGWLPLGSDLNLGSVRIRP